MNGVEAERARRLKRLAGKARAAIADRDQAIVEANAEGASLRDIAKVIDMPHTSVAEIVKRYVEPMGVWTAPVAAGTRYTLAGGIPARRRLELFSPTTGEVVELERNESSAPITFHNMVHESATADFAWRFAQLSE